MGEDIFTAICGVLVINIHIIVYGAPRVPSCRVQSAPLSTAGVGGKGRAGLQASSLDTREKAGPRLRGHLRGWSCLSGKEGERREGIFMGTVRKQS